MTVMIEEKKKSSNATSEAVEQKDQEAEKKMVLETEPVVDVQTSVESVSETTQKSTTDLTAKTEPTLTPNTAPKQSIASQKKDKDKLEKEIEEVLSEDLQDMYLSMPQEKQKIFKEKGEETVSKIHQIVHATKFNAKKVFHLIRDWLKMIPGINRFFLEQEAKIKTDKVLIVVEEEKRRGNKDLL